MVIICISLSNLFPYNLKWKLFLLYWYVFNSKWSVFCQVTSVLVLSRILLDLFILDSKPTRFMGLGLTLLVQGAQCTVGTLSMAGSVWNTLESEYWQNDINITCTCPQVACNLLWHTCMFPGVTEKRRFTEKL